MRTQLTKLASVAMVALLPALASAASTAPNRFTLDKPQRIHVIPSQVPPTLTRCLFDRVGAGERAGHVEIELDPHDDGAPLARSVVLGKGTWQVTFHSTPQPHPVAAGVDTAWAFEPELAYSGTNTLGTTRSTVVLAKIRKCKEDNGCTIHVPISLEAGDLPALGAAAASFGRTDPSLVNGHGGGRAFADDATTLTNDLLRVIADVAVDRFEAQALRATTTRLRDKLGCEAPDGGAPAASGALVVSAPDPLAASKLDRLLGAPGRKLELAFPATCAALDAVRLRDLASAGPALERAIREDLVRATTSVALRAIASSVDAWPSASSDAIENFLGAILGGRLPDQRGALASRETLVAMLQAARDHVAPGATGLDEHIVKLADGVVEGAALDTVAVTSVQRVLQAAWSSTSPAAEPLEAAVLAILRADPATIAHVRDRGEEAIARALRELGQARRPPMKLTDADSLSVAKKVVAFVEGAPLDPWVAGTVAAVVTGARGAVVTELVEVGTVLPDAIRLVRDASDSQLAEALKKLDPKCHPPPSASDLQRYVAELRNATAAGRPLDVTRLAALGRACAVNRSELVDAARTALIRSVLLDLERVADVIAAARAGKLPAQLAGTMLQAIRQTALAMLALAPDDRTASGLTIAVAALATIQETGRFDSALARDMLLHPSEYFSGVCATPGALTPALERFVASGAELLLPAKGTSEAELVRRAIRLYLEALAILAEGAPDARTVVATLEQVGRVADAVIARDNAGMLVAALELFRLHEAALKLPWGARGPTATRTLAAITSYAATYTAPPADDPGGKLRSAQRKQAVESIVELATDRSERATRDGSDAVVSLGVQVGGVLNSYRDLPGSRNLRPRLSLPLGVGLQDFWTASFGWHLQASFLDLGQYVAYTGEQERTDARWDTAVIAGGQIGISFGNFQNPFVLAFDARFAPGLFPHVEGRSAGTYSVGVSLGMYVPLLDFN